jgi:hypothetical protein
MSVETVRGVVEAYNFSPKGEVEGLLVRAAGGRVQVNLPKGAADPPPVGRAVELTVEPEDGGPKHARPAHPVYRAAAGPDAVVGTVARLNYTRHGEPNGVVLDTGDFVHLKPHGMRAAGLAVGDRVTAAGTVRPLATGGRAVDADEVNGRPVDR